MEPSEEVNVVELVPGDGEKTTKIGSQLGGEMEASIINFLMRT